jgi:threonine/homoserine/homoserine lactone efflux protein
VAWRLCTVNKGLGAADDSPTVDGSRSGWWWTCGEGVVVQLANPKVAVFMIAFYPQFVPADRPLFATTAGLALLQVLIETALYLALAGCVSRARHWFAISAVRRHWDVISGGVLIGLRIRIATTSR